MPLTHPSQSLVSRPKASDGFAPSPVPILADPQSIKAEVTPADLRNPTMPDEQLRPTTSGPTLTAAQGQALLQSVRKKRTAGRALKSFRGREYYESRAALLGYFDYEWDNKQGRFLQMKGPDKKPVKPTSVNLVRGKVQEHIAHLTQGDPEIGFRPWSDSVQDAAAAHQARAGYYDWQQRVNDSDQVREAIQESCQLTPLWWIRWNPSKSADVPKLAPDGSVVSVHEIENMGQIERDLIPWCNWMSAGGSFDKTSWVMVEQTVRLTELQAYYKNGYAVQPEAGVYGDQSVSTLIAHTNQEYRFGSGSDDSHWAVLTHLFERPTPELTRLGYPDGRWTTSAGDTILHVQNLDDGWPLCPVYTLKIHGDSDGQGFIWPMLSAQRGINSGLSDMIEHAALPQYNVLLANGTQLSRTAFKGRDMQLIDFTGMAPQVLPKPPYSPHNVNLFQIQRDLLDVTSGINRFSEGNAPKDLSAAAIRLIQGSDLSSTKDALQNLMAAIRWSAETVMRIMAKRYSVPRMVYQQDDPPAQSGQPAPALGALSFRALCGGGRVHIKMSADSEDPKTPAESIQFVTQMLTPQSLALPVLPATIAVLKAVDVQGTTPVADELAKALEQMQAREAAMQPNPAQIQQMKQDAAAQAQQADQQHDAQMAAVQEQVQSQKAQLDNEHAQVMAAIAAHQEQAMEAIDLHKQEVMAQLNAENEARLKVIPAVTLGATADPTATVDLEQEIGLEGKVPPPPTVAPVGGMVKSNAAASKKQ